MKKKGFDWTNSQSIYESFKFILEARNDYVSSQDLINKRDKNKDNISKQLAELKKIGLISINRNMKIKGKFLIMIHLGAFNSNKELKETCPDLAKFGRAFGADDLIKILLGALSFNHAESCATVLLRDNISAQERDDFLKIFSDTGSTYSALRYIENNF